MGKYREGKKVKIVRYAGFNLKDKDVTDKLIGLDFRVIREASPSRSDLEDGETPYLISTEYYKEIVDGCSSWWVSSLCLAEQVKNKDINEENIYKLK